MRVRTWAVAGVVVGGLLGCPLGCSDLQGEHACPGHTCTDALQGVVDDVAAVEGVTRVDRVGWSSGLDNGAWGRVEVQARVDGVPAARRIARRAALLFRSGDDEEVEGLVVVVRPVDTATEGPWIVKPPFEFSRPIRHEFIDVAPLGSGLREVG